MSLKAKVLFLASMAAFLRPFAHVIYVPSQVTMRQQLGTTTSMMGLSLSVYALVFAVSQILYGPIVDRFDGRRVLLFGMGLFVLSSFGLYFASTVEVLLLLRGVQGLGIAAAVIVGLALISDVIPQGERGRAMGIFEISSATGATLGPIIGAALSALFLWRADFLVLALMGLAMLLYAYWVLPAQPVRAQKVSLDDIYLILRKPATRGAIIVGLVMFYGLFTMFTILPLFLVERYGFGVGQVGLLVSLMPLGAIFGSALGGRASDRGSQRTITLVGSLGACVTFGLLTLISWQSILLPSITLVAANVAACGFMIGFVLPSQLKIMVDHFPEMRATASGISIFARFIGATLAPVISGYLADCGGLAAGFGFASLLFALGTIVTFLYIFDTPAGLNRSAEEDLPTR